MNFVKTDLIKDIAGTDLTPDIVDTPDDMDLIKTGESMFDPSNPTYLVAPSESYNGSVGTCLPTDVVRPVPRVQEDDECRVSGR